MGRLGEIYLRLGRYEQAATNLEQSLARSRELGDRAQETIALNALGEVMSQTGDNERSRAYHTEAFRVASEIGVLREQARAHSGLARTYQADGNALEARQHWQEALDRFTAIDDPEAWEVRAQLAATRSKATCE
jgi:tetratricopeptide (TPR) repeat protein